MCVCVCVCVCVCLESMVRVQLDAMCMLIEVKCDVNVGRDNGANAIYVAAQNGHKHCVDALISAKCSVNSLRADTGESAL